VARDARRARYRRAVRHRPRPRLLVAALLVALVLLAGGYAAFRAATDEQAEAASIATAVERFRALPPSARELPAALRGHAPQPGVYVYATRGGEVSHVLGTRRHRYPSTTTITVTRSPSGCRRERWDALATRWDATLVCFDFDLWRLVSHSEEHRFAGHTDRRTYRCTRNSMPQSSRCTSGGTTATTTVLSTPGRNAVTVEGRPVETVLLLGRTRLRGETTGTVTTRTWSLPGTGLVVRRTIAEDSTTDTLVGAVRYEERATLTLTSLTPRR
jgi:hypothetical protein